MASCQKMKDLILSYTTLPLCSSASLTLPYRSWKQPSENIPVHLGGEGGLLYWWCEGCMPILLPAPVEKKEHVKVWSECTALHLVSAS